MPIPQPVRLFHISAIPNLQGICAAGALLSKNQGTAAGIAYQDIAYQGAQGARAIRAAPNPPGGLVHDYVPFYFAPRSPMLGAIEKGRVTGCAWRQADIFHLETTVAQVTAGATPFVFYDRNATLPYSRSFTDLAHLGEVAWDLLTEEPRLDGFCKYWQDRPSVDRYADRMERRPGGGGGKLARGRHARLVLSGAIDVTVKITGGDLLRQDDVDAIVNTVNCVGVMGKGIALQFRNKWPENSRAYEIACKAKEVRLGRMFVFDSGGLVKPNYIINFPTKDHWRGKSSINSIREGLKDLVAQVKRLRIHSIAIPPLGCGNGGLNWSEVRPLVESAFAELPDVEARLFEPTGAPDPKSMEIKTKRPAMTPGRAAILKILDTYRALEYGLSRIEVQKLAYFLQEAGEDLKLSFVKHRYGPYSEELRHALNRMEGHFIRGLGDGVVEAEIEPVDDALAEADRFIEENGRTSLSQHVERVGQLIEGFQSPYGMELLATVHWVATREAGVHTFEQIVSAVNAWSERKATIMQSGHVRAAWDRLIAQGWLSNEVVRKVN